MKLRVRAPGKVNLCLFVGAARGDGRHELVTLFESVSLADELEVQAAAAGEDEVICPEVEGPNLVSRAVSGLRARGWDAPPVRLTIVKRVPVAAGMGGGSADAAAVLRLARCVGRTPSEHEMAELARSLGSDVPSQLRPGLTIGSGAGDEVKRLPALAPHAFVLVPQPFSLATADVYAEADRLGLARSAEDLARRWRELRAALRAGAELPAELLVNDLEPAAVSLLPEIRDALDAVRGAGAELAMVCGSGPTVLGLYWGAGAEARASDGAGALSGRYPGAACAVPVPDGFGDPVRRD